MRIEPPPSLACATGARRARPPHRQDDTVGHRVRQRRMDRIRRDLADPDLAHLSACAIAAR